MTSFSSLEHLNSNNSPFKFNAKELDEETGNYYYGARYYDPKFSIWLSVDPLAEKYPSWSPYSYTMNNPINLVDPDGRSVWEPDGEGNLVAEKNDDPTDRILKTDSDGNVKRKGEGFLGFLVKKSERGKAKVAVDGIKKGWLEDDYDFMTERSTFSVQGENELNKAFELISYLSSKFEREVGGFTATKAGSNEVSDIFLFSFAQDEKNHFEFPKGVVNYTRETSYSLNGNLNSSKRFLKEMFHTHLSNPRTSLMENGDDNLQGGKGVLRRVLEVNPAFLKTFILSPGGVKHNYDVNGLKR